MCDIVQGFVNEGRAEGIAEGAQQKAIEAAINLLKMDKLSPEEIAHAQGLPLEQVLELQKNISDFNKVSVAAVQLYKCGFIAEKFGFVQLEGHRTEKFNRT